MPGRLREANDCRCHCGALLARLVAGGVELKCRHCKRVQLVPLSTEDELGASAPARRESLGPELSR